MTEDIWMILIFIVYKIICLIVGLLFSYMGYQLFLADKTGIAGELSANSGKNKLTLKKAAPGTFFALFGTAVIAVTIIKGVEYSTTGQANSLQSPVEDILPDKPPA